MFNYSLILSILIIIQAFCVIWANNAISSILFLISIYLLSSVLFLILGVEFLSILLILVYVGAISILFIFVIWC